MAEAGRRWRCSNMGCGSPGVEHAWNLFEQFAIHTYPGTFPVLGGTVSTRASIGSSKYNSGQLPGRSYRSLFADGCRKGRILNWDCTRPHFSLPGKKNIVFTTIAGRLLSRAKSTEKDCLKPRDLGNLHLEHNGVFDHIYHWPVRGGA